MSELPHGASRYKNRGCRCETCREAMRAYRKARREAKLDEEQAKERARKKRYQGICENCGQPTSGTRSGHAKTPRWCTNCGQAHTRRITVERSRAYRNEIIRLWKEGHSRIEITRRLGITPSGLGSMIARMRADGENVPYRKAYKPGSIENLRANGRRAAKLLHAPVTPARTSTQPSKKPSV